LACVFSHFFVAYLVGLRRLHLWHHICTLINVNYYALSLHECFWFLGCVCLIMVRMLVWMGVGFTSLIFRKMWRFAVSGACTLEKNHRAWLSRIVRFVKLVVFSCFLLFSVILGNSVLVSVTQCPWSCVLLPCEMGSKSKWGCSKLS